MRIGAVVILTKAPSLEEELRKKFADLKKMGLESCQLVCWDPDIYRQLEVADFAKSLSQEMGVALSHFWCGYSGLVVWDFYEGERTIGIVPSATREKRTEELLDGVKFARRLGVPYLVTHAGYIPENPYDPNYEPTIASLKRIASSLKEEGMSFLFETGQETPVTLRRAIEDVGLGNLGVNLDPANLILYGKANPVDALDVLGPYVRGVHAKDGCYPTNGHDLGMEKRLGEGKANWPLFLHKLVHDYHYDYDWTIERECEEGSPEQIRDILYARDYLRKLLQEEGK